MKVTELRPCDNCGGPITPMFYVVRVSLALIKADAVNEFVGMHQFFGGRASAALVENFAPSSLDAVTVAGDKDASLMTELFICQTCHLEKPIDLPLLTERRRAAVERLAPQHESAQPCGCDPGAHWTCEQHRSAGLA